MPWDVRNAETRRRLQPAATLDDLVRRGYVRFFFNTIEDRVVSVLPCERLRGESLRKALEKFGIAPSPGRAELPREGRTDSTEPNKPVDTPPADPT